MILTLKGARDQNGKPKAQIEFEGGFLLDFSPNRSSNV